MKIKEYCTRKSNTFLHLAKGSLIAFRAVAKGNQIPFREDCMRNLRIACNPDNVSNIPLRGLNLKIKKYKQVLKLCLPPAVFIPMRAYRTIPLSGRSNLVRRYLNELFLFFNRALPSTSAERQIPPILWGFR